MRRLALSVATPGLAAVALAKVCAAWQEPIPQGKAPVYTDRTLSEIPNAAAMSRLIRSPGLDEGYVPQGLTILDGAIFVGTYRSEDTKQSRGPCRIYRLDPTHWGPIVEILDLPRSCGHAGGLARGGPGRLWVTRSGSTFGELLTLEPATGAAILRLDMPAGIEDISFAPDGGLWAVGEAGSKRWLGWETFFPVVFRLQPDLLR